MMIRPLAFLGCLAFLGTGFHVYNIKGEVDALDGELRRTLQATEAERVRSRTLSAEWARLNDQDRLHRLATTHLPELQPTTPQQFVRVADAARRLPGAVEFAGAASGFRARADASAMPGEVLVFSTRTMLADAAPRPRMSEAVAGAGVPAPSAAPPPVVARTEPPSPARTAAAAPANAPSRAVAGRAEPREAPLREAPLREAPLREAPLREAQARESPPRAADPSLRNAVHVRPAATRPSTAPAAAPLPPIATLSVGGSMLGGSGALPPPMPFRQ